PRQKLTEQRVQVQGLAQHLRFAMQQNHRFNAQQLLRQTQVLQHLRPDVSPPKREVAQFQTTLRQSFAILLKQRRQTLEKQSALLEAVSPQHILARGFSVVKNSRGQVVQSSAGLKQGQKLHIVFADGETDVRVTGETAQPDLFDFS
uniref:exodeoxyribonuclease VII large subunit n=1 Tax=Neisseria weixii TaxID=1853276 RepID=UPI0035A0FCDB